MALKREKTRASSSPETETATGNFNVGEFAGIWVEAELRTSVP